MRVPLLEFDRITKSFSSVPVLRGISFDLDSGQTLVLVGENGAGKSTLMNVLGGNLQPDGGCMRLEGRACAPSDPEDAAPTLSEAIALLPIGLGFADQGRPPAAQDVERLRRLRLGHLRLDLRLSRSAWRNDLRRAATLASQLGAGLHVARLHNRRSGGDHGIRGARFPHVPRVCRPRRMGTSLSAAFAQLPISRRSGPARNRSEGSSAFGSLVEGTQRVRLQLDAPHACLRMLHAGNAEPACIDLEGFWTIPGDWIEASAGAADLVLPPFALACLDVQAA